MDMSTCQIPLISVVDDDASVRESLSGLIRAVGFRAKTFNSADEFLASDRCHRTDCLILDVRLAGANGLDLFQYLTGNDFAIPVIFITAHGDEYSRARALENGAVDYLFKPFSEESLLQAIDTALKSGNRY